MMVYAGHVPSHFVLEISRGITNYFIYNYVNLFFDSND